MRINKYIAQSGLVSRRKADEYIIEGRVKVNGKVVTMLGFEIRKRDKVTLDDKLIIADKLEYYKFYKPSGYITTKTDEKNRKTIYDLLPENLRHLNPVGRLDKDSSGLIILTNDGNLLYELTHPSIKVAKTYIVRVEGILTNQELQKLTQGIEIEKGKMAYCEWEILEKNKNDMLFEIVLHQGLNRQIRKMFEFLGHNVINLKRIRHANIELTGLKRGEVKIIKPRQIKEMKQYLDKLKEQNNA
ncbi:rRNA pseudouridine synthase [bacterium]|nr:rRNA pseudouridine synthase [bacterium]